MQVAEDWLYDESAEQIVLFTKNVCCCNCTMQVAEDWLYDEGEDVNKSVYASKLDEMKVLGGPIEERYMENEMRPVSFTSLM